MSEPLIRKIRPLQSRPDLSGVVPSVDVVIVNWNGGDALIRCVDALLDVAADGASPIRRLVVVDNASSDGSIDQLEDRAKVAVLRNDSNVGFGRACNYGARGCEADLLLFLNPDVVVNHETIATCVVFLSDPANSSVGIVGPQLVGASGEVQKTCSRLPTWTSLVVRTLGLDRLRSGLFDGAAMMEWDHSRTRDVGQVIGAFMLVRRSVFEALGGFDERFFLYYEDVDLCARNLAAGYRVTYLHTARAEHIGNVSSSQVPAKRLWYSFASRAEYAHKYFGPTFAAFLSVLMVIGEAPIRTFVALLHGRMSDALDAWRAVGEFVSRPLPSEQRGERRDC